MVYASIGHGRFELCARAVTHVGCFVRTPVYRRSLPVNPFTIKQVRLRHIRYLKIKLELKKLNDAEIFTLIKINKDILNALITSLCSLLYVFVLLFSVLVFQGLLLRV